MGSGLMGSHARSLIEFNPLSTFASHLMYWQDEDLSHFVSSQLLSRRRTGKGRGKGSGSSEEEEREVKSKDGGDRGRKRYADANWI